MKKTRSVLKIDPKSSVALHEQVAAAIRRAVADGEARPGERLPPARDLAAVLCVNPNTVLRALRTLRDEGLLEFRRGRGVTVSEDASRKNELILKGNEFIEVGRRLGYRPEELIQIISSLAPASRKPNRAAAVGR